MEFHYNSLRILYITQHSILDGLTYLSKLQKRLATWEKVHFLQALENEGSISNVQGSESTFQFVVARHKWVWFKVAAEPSLRNALHNHRCSFTSVGIKLEIRNNQVIKAWALKLNNCSEDIFSFLHDYHLPPSNKVKVEYPLSLTSPLKALSGF